MAAYADVIMNDEGADLTKALRDLANMGASGDLAKSKELMDKMDSKNFKGGSRGKEMWLVNHIKKDVTSWSDGPCNWPSN